MKEKKNLIRILNRDMLKYIALLVMFVGHFLTYTIKELRFLGMPKSVASVLVHLQYMAPPIFFFFIAEGFRYTKSKKAYAIRLFVFAFITQFAYVLMLSKTFDAVMFFTSWNVIMELFMGLLVLIIWESKLPLPFRILLVTICCAVSHLLKMEWGIAGLLIILAFHIFREKPLIRLCVYELIVLAYTAVIKGGIRGILSSWGLIIPMTLAIVLITFFYNGKKGRHPKFSKYFFYIFYPAHLILIYLVKVIAG